MYQRINNNSTNNSSTSHADNNNESPFTLSTALTPNYTTTRPVYTPYYFNNTVVDLSTPSITVEHRPYFNCNSHVPLFDSTPTTRPPNVQAYYVYNKNEFLFDDQTPIRPLSNLPPHFTNNNRVPFAFSTPTRPNYNPKVPPTIPIDLHAVPIACALNNNGFNYRSPFHCANIIQNRFVGPRIFNSTQPIDKSIVNRQINRSLIRMPNPNSLINNDICNKIRKKLDYESDALGKLNVTIDTESNQKKRKNDCEVCTLIFNVNLCIIGILIQVKR